MTCTVLPAPRPGTAAAAKWELVQRAQTGDQAAFAEIYRNTYDFVWRFICYRVANRDVADDLAADVYVRALNRIHTVTWQGRDIEAWLIVIARNLVADWFKSSRKKLERLVDLRPGAEHELRDHILVDSSAEGDVETLAVGAIAGEDVRAAVERLLPRQREVILLRFFEGLDLRQTADRLGIDVTCVKSLQFRATRALARDEQVADLAGAA